MWFCVSALTVAEHPDGSVPSEERLWEEHLFLVTARDSIEAQAKAEKLAKSDECSYAAANGSNVRWKFKAISKIYEIGGAPGDGVEVFSRFLKDSEVRSLLASLTLS